MLNAGVLNAGVLNARAGSLGDSHRIRSTAFRTARTFYLQYLQYQGALRTNDCRDPAMAHMLVRCD